MKISFDNYLIDSTLSAEHASLNYPVTNLQNPVLRKRYQCAINSDTITVTFSESLDVNCFFYGYTNATYIQVRLYSGSVELLYTLTINDPQDIGAHFFTLVEGVDYAEIDILGAEGVYLGGCCFDDVIEFPDPENAWNEPMQDNSSTSENVYGSTYTDYIEPLRVYSWKFLDITRDNTNYFVELYKLTGIGKPIWIDPFERDHDFIKPIYAKLTAPFQPKKNGRRYNFTLDIKECR